MTSGQKMGAGGAYDLTTPVFGDLDERGRFAVIEAFCHKHLGSTVTSPLFWHESIGIVAGFELSDGGQVVIKIFQPDISSRFLDAVEAIRRQLVAAGFPCPLPLAGPFPMGNGMATVERFEQIGQVVNPRSETSIRSVARTLAQLIRAGAEMDKRHLEALDTGGPWRLRYSADPWDLPDELDFVSHAATVAQELYEPVSSRGRTLGHGDWRMPNMGFDSSGEVVAVFDWDSLQYVPECWTVGVAASVFSAGAAGDPNESRPPSLATSAHFLDEYEAARGRGFSVVERKGAAGALLYALSAVAVVQFYELQEPPGQRREWLAGGHYLETVRDQWQAYAALRVSKARLGRSPTTL